MKKTRTIKLIGISVEGHVEILTWNNMIGEIEMNPVFLPLDKATKDNILMSINDGGFGCQRIITAYIQIYSKYDNGSLFFEKRIDTAFQGHLNLSKRGI
ncbi:hypothetical protein H8D36_03280 [archaeon]|nr:hypothetical protein [archaeon]